MFQMQHKKTRWNAHSHNQTQTHPVIAQSLFNLIDAFACKIEMKPKVSLIQLISKLICERHCAKSC